MRKINRQRIDGSWQFAENLQCNLIQISVSLLKEEEAADVGQDNMRNGFCQVLNKQLSIQTPT